MRLPPLSGPGHLLFHAQSQPQHVYERPDLQATGLFTLLATQNYKDFTNLMDVYLDSTFFPLLRETDFSQEGIRFELKEKGNKQSELAAKGVVYNEMKGAMANPSSLIHRRLNEALYPTTHLWEGKLGWRAAGDSQPYLGRPESFPRKLLSSQQCLFFFLWQFPFGQESGKGWMRRS